MNGNIDNGSYNNNYFNRLIDFIEKQTAIQLEFRHKAEDIEKTVCDTNEAVKSVQKCINKMTIIVGSFCVLFALAWGIVSFSADKIVTSKIDQYNTVQVEESKKKEELTIMIKQILAEQERLRNDEHGE